MFLSLFLGCYVPQEGHLKPLSMSFERTPMGLETSASLA